MGKGKSYSMIRVFSFLILAMVFCFGTAVPSAFSASDKPISIKLSSWLPEMTNEGKMAKWWGTQLEERSKGRVKVEYYFAQSLVKTMDSLPAVSAGIADVQFVADGYFPTQLPLIGGLHLLYQTESGYLMNKAALEMDRSFPPFRQMLTRNNIKLVMPLSAGGVAMISKTPIRTLEDLKGKKIRAMGLMNKAMQMLGATPVAIPLPEVYEALERGTIDAVTGLPYHLITAFKLNEVAKYVVGTGMGCYASGGYYINLDVWQELPDDIKAIIEEINSEAAEVAADLANSLQDKITSTLLASKCQIYKLSQSEIDRWKSKVVPDIYDDWAAGMEERNLPGKKTLEIYRSLLAKYESMDKYKSPYQ